MKAGEVIVYVEGPSDKLAMEALLDSLLQQRRREGLVIRFFEAPKGDKKVSVLTKVPRMAVDIIRNSEHSIVVPMPDLYPKNKGFPHETVDELKAGILRNFNDALHRKGFGDDNRIGDRFKVFCFKYDLEALILAAEKALKSRLGLDRLNVTWSEHVEDQDHDNPPKRIVEKLFEEHGETYQDTEDAPLILGESDYRDTASKCPQCFKPFVEFLSNLQLVSYHNQFDDVLMY